MPEDFRPWTWKPPETTPVDKGMSRQDAHEKLSGQAIFTRDVTFSRNAVRKNPYFTLCPRQDRKHGYEQGRDALSESGTY